MGPNYVQNEIVRRQRDGRTIREGVNKSAIAGLAPIGMAIAYMVVYACILRGRLRLATRVYSACEAHVRSADPNG